MFGRLRNSRIWAVAAFVVFVVFCFVTAPGGAAGFVRGAVDGVGERGRCSAPVRHRLAVTCGARRPQHAGVWGRRGPAGPSPDTGGGPGGEHDQRQAVAAAAGAGVAVAAAAVPAA